MISTAGSLRSTNTTTTSTRLRVIPIAKVPRLPFVLKVVILGDDVIWVRERFPRHLERNSMVPLVALHFRRIPRESHFHVFIIVYSNKDRSKRVTAIRIEGGSINTHENAILSYQLLAPRGIRRILLVTSAMHMPVRKATQRVVYDR
jgi:hypothetical protein